MIYNNNNFICRFSEENMSGACHFGSINDSFLIRSTFILLNYEACMNDISAGFWIITGFILAFLLLKLSSSGKHVSL